MFFFSTAGHSGKTVRLKIIKKAHSSLCGREILWQDREAENNKKAHLSLFGRESGSAVREISDQILYPHARDKKDAQSRKSKSTTICQ